MDVVTWGAGGGIVRGMSSELPLPSTISSHRVSRASSRRRRWSPTRKRALLRQFAVSGVSAAQFCREQGLSEVTFLGWRRGKLALGVEASAPSAACASSETMPFARVRVLAPGPAPDGAGAMVRIEAPGDWRLAVPVGCDPAWVAQLVGLWPKG